MVGVAASLVRFQRRKAERRADYWKTSCLDARAKLQDEYARAEAAKLNRGRDGQRFFSTRGGFTMAIRRCISATSSYSLGLAMGLDVHPTTVSA